MKRFVMIFAALAAIGLLASCAQRDYAQQDHQYCENMGLQWGTPEYGQCRMAIVQWRQQQHANRIAAYNSIFGGRQRSTCSTNYGITRCY